jgi:fructose-bisphosphate aldolase class II
LPVFHSKDLLTAKSENHTVAVAFNVISLEHAEGIVAGAEKAQRPVILQLSENAIAFHSSAHAIAAGMYQVAKHASVPVVLHLDHITNLDLVKQTADLGFSSVMFDAAHLDYAANVEHTAEIAAWAHENGLWLESELGEIGGKDGAHAPGVRTNPQDAANFVAATGVDALAVAVGSSHAMSEKSASLDLELIKEIKSLVSVPLVLHGSSGVPDDLLVRATQVGMKKINIGTALNIAYTNSVREFLINDAKTSDPRKYTKLGRAAISELVEYYLKLLVKN